MPETFPDHPPMAAMPSAPRQRLRYARILEAAAGFARKGLESVDLPAVAEKADVPLGTLYRYFPTSTHLMLALYRHQLTELQSDAPQAAGWSTQARFRGRALAGLVMEIFHMRVMQPAVEQCLSRGVYLPDRDTTVLLREIDALGEKVVVADRHWSGPVGPEPPSLPVRGRGRPQKGVRTPLAGCRSALHNAPERVTGLDQGRNKYALLA